MFLLSNPSYFVIEKKFKSKLKLNESIFSLSNQSIFSLSNSRKARKNLSSPTTGYLMSKPNYAIKWVSFTLLFSKH